MRGDRRRSGLTSREREVLGLVRLGLTNEEIAGRLGISLDTAKYHVSQILQKLGVASREEASALPGERILPWWARALAWSAAAKAAGVTVMLAVVIGLGVMAWAVLATGSGDSHEVTYNGAIGSFNDTTGYKKFADDLAKAVANKDVQWLVDHSAHMCATNVDQCAQNVSDASRFGVTLHLLHQGDEPLGAGRATSLLGDDYAAFLRDFFDRAVTGVNDEFGSSSPALYGVGLETVPLQSPHPESGPMTAVVTAILGGEANSSTAPTLTGRSALMFEATNVGGSGWFIPSLETTDSPLGLISLDQALDPVLVKAPPGFGPFWNYWQRWPLATPAPSP